MRLRAIIFLCLFLAACGKKGQPTPPVPSIPKDTTDLRVAQRGSTVILSWSYPSLTTAGAQLRDIRKLVVYRYVEDLPPSLSATEAEVETPGQQDAESPTAIQLFEKVPPIVPMQFDKLKVKVESLTAEKLPDVTVGTRILYEDHPALRTEDGRPVRVTYGVVTEAAGGRSNLSNLVTIIPLIPAIAPSGLTATAGTEGVALEWKPAIAGIQNLTPTVIGYNIYRIPKDEPLLEPLDPVNAKPVEETTYRDRPPFGAYRYAVTAVAAAGPPPIQSEPSGLISVEFKDLQAPPPPAAVHALIEEDAVRLVWEPVEASDLAGYRVYRAESGRTTRLTEGTTTQTNFRDPTATPGVTYTYSVTSVDVSGNESAGTTAEESTVTR